MKESDLPPDDIRRDNDREASHRAELCISRRKTQGFRHLQCSDRPCTTRRLPGQISQPSGLQDADLSSWFPAEVIVDNYSTPGVFIEDSTHSRQPPPPPSSSHPLNKPLYDEVNFSYEMIRPNLDTSNSGDVEIASGFKGSYGSFSSAPDMFDNNWTQQQVVCQSLSSAVGSPQSGLEYSQCSHFQSGTSDTSAEYGAQGVMAENAGWCPHNVATTSFELVSPITSPFGPKNEPQTPVHVGHWLKSVPSPNNGSLSPSYAPERSYEMAMGYSGHTASPLNDNLVVPDYAVCPLGSPSTFSLDADILSPKLLQVPDLSLAMSHRAWQGSGFEGVSNHGIGKPQQGRRHSDSGLISNKKHQCPKCGLLLADRKGCNRHYLAKHTTRRHLTCGCGRAFMRSDHLQRHGRTCPLRKSP